MLINKELQMEIMRFFLTTSIPKMLEDKTK